MKIYYSTITNYKISFYFLKLFNYNKNNFVEYFKIVKRETLDFLESSWDSSFLKKFKKFKLFEIIF